MFRKLSAILVKTDQLANIQHQISNNFIPWLVLSLVIFLNRITICLDNFCGESEGSNDRDEEKYTADSCCKRIEVLLFVLEASKDHR